MNTVKEDHIAFTESERALVTELLERESKELPVEIRHTDSRTFRDRLRARLAIVNRLLQRLRQTNPS